MGKRVFRKGKKLSGGPKSFRKWADWDDGDFLIGKYTGTHTDQYDKECAIVDVIEASFKNKKEAKELTDKTIVLNATGQLNKAMESMDVGKIYQFTYGGMAMIEKGKYKDKEAHVIVIEELEEEGDEAEEETEEEEIDL